MSSLFGSKTVGTKDKRAKITMEAPADAGIVIPLHK
jgi:hypothetical protein